MATPFIDPPLSEEEVAMYRKEAKAAEPYTENDDIYNVFDGEMSEEEQMRRAATAAIGILKHYGVPLEE